MAEITFVGAAGTVTGSKHLVQCKGKRFFVDCGLFQGLGNADALNHAPLPVEAREIDAVVVTHGHIDHVGYLPKLVRDGFRGPIFATKPTASLMQIVLDDAAHLQEELHVHGYQHSHHPPLPFYEEADVAAAMRLVHAQDLGETFDLLGVARVTYRNAAHIVGSAFAQIDLDGARAVFSGDLGRYGRPLLFDPDAIGAADVIVSESTYGDRVHPEDSIDGLHAALLDAIARNGAVVIPAFAVERSQMLLFAIGRLQAADTKLAGLPIHLDSPMAEKVDDLFANFPNAHRSLPAGCDIATFGCDNLTVHRTAEESKQLNRLKGAHVVISASGMASGGRILHHLHNHLSDDNAVIVFVGYQGAGTLGHVLVNGAPSVRIYGDTLAVRAKIMSLQGFSAHADRNDFTRWFGTCTTTPHLYAVHGEPESATALAALAHQQRGWTAAVAQRGLTVTV